MSEIKRLLKNTGIIALGNISTKLVSFLLLPLYTSLLSTSEYGTVDYIESIVLFIVPFASMLMDEAVFRFLIDCDTDEKRKKTISISVKILMAGLLAFLIIAIPIILFLRFQYGAFLILNVVGNVFIVMMNSLLRGMGRTDRYAVYNFLLSLVRIIFNIVFIAGMRMGATGLLLAATLSMFFVTAVYFVRMKIWRYIDVTVSDRKQTKDMLRYAIPLVPNKVSWSIINLSDRIIIMNLLGGDAAGIYAIAYKFPNLMDTIYGFFYQSWKESSARVVGDDSQDSFYNSIYAHLRRFMFSVVLMLIAWMPLIFAVLIHSGYSNGILYVPILIIGMYYSNMSGFYGGIFTAYKETKIMGTTTAAAAVVNLAVHFLLIGTINLYAAAVSTLVSSYVVYAYRRMKVKQYVILNREWKVKVLSYAVLTVILICFYEMTTVSIAAGMLISTTYTIIMNRRILIRICNKITGRIRG